MNQHTIISIQPLGFMWPVSDPFLFCAHHLDQYPAGNSVMGPAASLTGRTLGQDFTVKDGWRMYHGETIPGFPAHPHRGFETITIVKKGFVDHSDSHGQTGRYGNGDVQWMTAGEGLQHCEMFPLLNTATENPLELFQVWLNLPKAKKYSKPYFKMLWSKNIPLHPIHNEAGHSAEINVIAGTFGDTIAPLPAPDSWATDAANDVAVWTIRMDSGATFTMPAAQAGTKRTLFFYRGSSLNINGTNVDALQAIEVKADELLSLVNGNSEGYLLVLQGKPINEPVVQYGPFVMNTQAEIEQAMNDYRRTEFGGWPWSRYDVVHPRNQARFARYIDGTEENP